MGNSGFGFRSTAEKVTKDVDASGITAIITGSTSGIGLETARVLALRGAHVYITGRSEESATKAKRTILKELPNAKLDILAPLDLSSQESIRKCAKSFLAMNRPLNLLINNAGIMMTPFGLTMDGIESQFGTNHIGHFLLTNLLLDKLKETANETGIESRIVNVSSAAIGLAPRKGIQWDALNEKKSYKPLRAYSISKIANVYMAQELARHLEAEGVTNVTANSLHPGVIRTNLGRHNTALFAVSYAVTYPFWKSVPQGAATTCYVALHPSVKGVSGKFFTDSTEDKATRYTPIGADVEAAKKLWDFSLQLTSPDYLQEPE